ncbi:MAG: serine/threonine protein kinase [Planctomycetales bacterium]|nr:serine/threonine protein kinase [Planctomycetales bacterium]
MRRSRLVEEDPLQRFLSDWTSRQGAAALSDSAAIAQGLVDAELLTSWQADKLLAGKHKGFMLGKYKLLEHLGKGGMSSVYLAEHTLMKRKVAIKVLPRNRVEDATYLERFRIEARAAAKLDDPNIVRAYDIDQDGDTHYIVMEYVQGRNLHELVRDQGPLPYETAADYIAQVARGLSHAHEMGLVHRDIKPANCLVDKNQTVKLLDLGLARLIDDEASLTLDNNENVLGTADYLAPEQALNSHKADTRADIYSLGCTLYFLLTGHPPFPEGTISERLLKHQVEQPSSILKDRPDASPTLVNICNRMMSKKPEERYQTATEVAQRLSEWLADRGRDVGDSGKRSGSEGLGSDVFRRFAASLNRGSTEAASRSGKIAPAPTTPAVALAPEEEIGLAPLDDDSPEKSAKPEKSQPSGAGKKASADPAAETVSNAAAASDTNPAGPRRSLVEEELERGNSDINQLRPTHRPPQFDPLRPPGYTGPQYGTPAWVYVLVGSVLLVMMGTVIAIVLSFAS